MIAKISPLCALDIFKNNGTIQIAIIKEAHHAANTIEKGHVCPQRGTH